MADVIKILHIEDLPTDAELVDYELKKGLDAFEKVVVDNRHDFLKMLGEFEPDIVLSDHSLPSFDSVDALAILKEKKIDVPFILVTATVSEEFAVEIMKQGASDYILKDRLQRLPSAVLNSLEKHRLEEEQRAAHERLSFHIENTPLGFIEWDHKGFAKSWSKRAAKIFGWKDKRGTGKPEKWVSQTHPDDSARVSKLIAQLVSGEVERNTIQQRNVRKDGQVIWCEWFNSVLKDRDGHVKTIMSLVQDITEQKLLETQKDDFLSMASHELKTPVTTIKAYGQIAEEMLAEKGDTETLGVISRMGSQVNKLTALISSLLDFTRMQGDKLLYSTSVFNFIELAKEVVSNMQKTSYTHEISYLPGEEATVTGDKDKIGQLIENLISNAIKYSAEAKNIIVRTCLQNGGIQLSVQDFGIGISPENQASIFQRFFRIGGVRGATIPGLGIGLYICSEIIKKHSGKIWMESTPGSGSTFHIWLPIDHTRNDS
jgi:PAS domain S-box-containing protein